MTPEEEWRPVVGYEGRYEVSNLGRVRSLDRRVRSRYQTRRVQGQMLKPGTNRNGYWMISFWMDCRSRLRSVHSVVAEAFIGPRPPGLFVCHGDGDKSNNVATNLRYDTPAANSQDALAHGQNCKANRTECQHGHAYTPENTVYDSRGGRRCLICRTAQRTARNLARRVG